MIQQNCKQVSTLASEVFRLFHLFRNELQIHSLSTIRYKELFIKDIKGKLCVWRQLKWENLAGKKLRTITNMLSSKNDKILPGWIGSQGTDFVERKALQKRINIMSQLNPKFVFHSKCYSQVWALGIFLTNSFYTVPSVLLIISCFCFFFPCN